MDFITSFFGRFHPLLVHLPIGILLLAFIFECLSLSEKYKGLRKAIQPALLFGAVFSIAAAVTGYFLRQEGGYDERLANLHQYFGISTAVLSLVVYALRPKVKNWVSDPRAKRRLKLALSVPLILLLTLTGHWGGSLTHGEDYLSAAVTLNTTTLKDPAEKIRTIANVEQAVLYNDVIQPILEARCYDCHSASKQKGDLRLDSKEYIMRGGKEGLVISDGPADSSALYKRLMLPLEHEDHMPPNEKPQLTSSEIALIQYWIEDDANFDKTVADFSSAGKITGIVKSLQEAPLQSWIPDNAVGSANEKAIATLQELGITPMPLSQGNNYLMVTFSGWRSITDEQLARLQDIEEQLVWLNLSHTAVSDQQMDAISKLRNLRVLYLNNTEISDAGLAKLAGLTGLRSLSLVGTKVSDASVPTFAGFKNLNNLFLYGTNVTRDGIQQVVDGRKEVKVDTGNYVLEKLPTDTIVFKKVTAK